jgi:putative DNA primase/helicase
LAQELFDRWGADLEHRLRAEEDYPVPLSHLAKYRSLLPSLALLFHLIDGVDAGTRWAVARA